ncbi:MAG: serine hydrolase [Lachnospiraceae bacterium]|nr:serine hydrolase [Lachnospiraceae bacterium]
MFLACLVMAALLVVVGILRMNTQNSINNQTNVTAQRLIAEYAGKQEDLHLTAVILDGESAAVTVYGMLGGIIEEPEEKSTARQYEIGSLTKTFVGALFAQYVTEGKVKIDDPVSIYVDFGGKYDPTVKQLLTHTSAYADYRTNSFIQMAKFRLNRNPYRGISSEKVPVFMRRFSTGETAPHEYSFSNFGYAVLGKAAESIEGKPFAEVMEAYIRDDLGLSGTSFSGGEEITKAWKWENDDAYLPAAGLKSNAGDLIRYTRLYFDGASNEAMQLAVTPLARAEGSSSVAYGWGIRPDGVVGHGGETSVCGAQILFDSSAQHAVIVLADRSGSGDVTLSSIAEKLYEENFEK